MYMIYHGDHEDMVFNQPKCFDDKAETIAHAEADIKKGIPKGHALTLYDCSERKVWEANDECATLYMSGPPEAVMRDAYDNGPSPSRVDVASYMPDGHVLVGKSPSGKVISREIMINGTLAPWTEE